jgi:hypothetical protein
MNVLNFLYLFHRSISSLFQGMIFAKHLHFYFTLPPISAVYEHLPLKETKTNSAQVCTMYRGNKNKMYVQVHGSINCFEGRKNAIYVFLFFEQ